MRSVRGVTLSLSYSRASWVAVENYALHQEVAISSEFLQGQVCTFFSLNNTGGCLTSA